MKKTIMSFSITCVVLYTQAQQLAPVSLCAAGKSSVVGNIMLEDHIGGFVISSINTSTFLYTQGFLQPDKGSTTETAYIIDVTLGGGSGIDNAGASFNTKAILLEFSVGETASKTIAASALQLTQGLLQPLGPVGHYWTGFISTDWFTKGNWSAGFVPLNSTRVIVPAGCPNYPVITSSQPAWCKSIEVRQGASTTLTANSKLTITQ